MKLSDIRCGDFTVGDCGTAMDTVPAWMDFPRFLRGQEFFHRHCTAVLLAMHCSLVTGLSIINLLNPLVFTKKSDTPKKSFARYFQTFLHLTMWHLEDVWMVDSRAHRSVKTVRKMHNTISARMNKGRSDTDKLFFSQYDMALVQSGFMAAIIMYPDGFGVKCTKQELSDYVFFWRGLGYLLGIEDDYNLCKGTLDETVALVKEIERKILLPSLIDPPKLFEPMAEAYVKGCGIPIITKESIFAFVAEGMDCKMNGLSMMDYLGFLQLKTIFFLIRWCPYFEKLANYGIKKLYYSQIHNVKLF